MAKFNKNHFETCLFLVYARINYTWDQLPHTTQNTVDAAAQALQRLMNDPAVWQDSELTGNKIVHLVGTNRTYIQQAAKQLGFENLSDMINRRRIYYPWWWLQTTDSRRCATHCKSLLLRYITNHTHNKTHPIGVRFVIL